MKAHLRFWIPSCFCLPGITRCLALLFLFFEVVTIPAYAGFLYVLNNDLDQAAGGSGTRIYSFSVNEATGSLAPLTGFPVATGYHGRDPLTMDGATEMLALHANGSNAKLFAINTYNSQTIANSISSFRIDRTSGALSALPYSPIPLPTPNVTGAGYYPWACVKIHPSGTPLVAAEPGGKVVSYNLSDTSAVSAAGSPYSTFESGMFSSSTPRPHSCSFSEDGSFLYMGGNWDFKPDDGTIQSFENSPTSTIKQYSVDASSGVLTSRGDYNSWPLSPGSAKPNLLGYATDSAGRLFAASQSTPKVFALDIGSGAIAGGTANASALAADDKHPNAKSAILHPAGYYIVAAPVTGQIGVYKVNGDGATTTLSAVQGSPFSSAGLSPTVLALNGAGSLLFAVDSDARTISTFSFNTATGTLTPLSGAASSLLGATGRITGVAYLPDLPSADLSIAKTASANPTVGANLTYTLAVTNNGPSSATDAMVNDTLPASVTFVSATPTQGTCAGTSAIACNLGALAAGGSASVTIVVKPTAAGNLVNTASVSAGENDPSPANNQASASSTIGACSNSLSQTGLNAGPGAISGTLNVIAAAVCTWTAISQVDWIHVTSGAEGTGNGTVGFSVDANTGSAARTGTVTIAGQTFTVTQAAATSSCSNSISLANLSIDSAALSGSLSVSALDACSWTAVSQASWIAVTSGNAGSGYGIVGFSIAENTGTSTRTGTVLIAGQTFTITQSGSNGAPTVCTRSITPTSQTVSASGGNGSIAVSASPNTCTWTAASSVNWIVVNSGSIGTANGTVAYSVSANTLASSRSGTLSIAGQTFTITQNGATQPTRNLIRNPGFESGATVWTQTSSGGYLPIVNSSAYSPHAGSYYAWLGGYNSGTDTIEQSVAIPSSAKSAKLEFWYRIETSETTTSSAWDSLTVEFYNLSGSKLTTLATLSNLNKTNGAWVKSSTLDVLAYKGQTVRLRFTGKTDSTNLTSFLIDDVSLAVSPGGAGKAISPILMLLLD